jgi:NAD(P)-dependent dehydrogenase (short-subunit alcohol dehydrogenase family)
MTILFRPLAGRVVVVTGASGGIGRVTAGRLTARGARVVACARDGDRLATLAAERPGLVPVTADVTVEADRERLVDVALRRYGRIDALVNNAGIGWVGPVEEMPADAVRQLVETNTVAVIELTRLVVPGMLARRRGDIVMVSSAAVWVPLPSLVVYSASKAAVDGFVVGLRREVGARGVLVHSVNPGPVRTQWLPRSAGTRPGDDEGVERPGPGVPPAWVSDAVEGCLVRPWPRTLGVPRLVELGRLAQLPGANRVLDLALGPAAPALASWARQLAGQRVQDPSSGGRAGPGPARR